MWYSFPDMESKIPNSTPIRTVCFTGHRDLPPRTAPAYRQLVAAAGLNDPFEPEGLKAACEAAARWLDGCDMTKIK